jgi:CRISPR-associated protein Cas2
MVVVVLSDCPAKLRGDLSKWLFEINTGVYVGNLSARVRELLWARICENVRHGQATMVYSAKGEQKLEFCVHNTSWKVVDYDGIKLMQRPLPKNSQSVGESEHSVCAKGFSKAAQFEKNNRIQRAKQRQEAEKQEEYVVVDVETTGLSHLTDEIIEIGALRVSGGKPVEEFHSLVRCCGSIPETVKKLTGITDEEMQRDGRDLHAALQKLNEFLGDSMLICHNAAFDLNFIQSSCRKENLPVPRNRCIDTLNLSRKKLKGIRDFKLQTIAEELSVDTTGAHRALRDCYITYGIYTKLNEI